MFKSFTKLTAALGILGLLTTNVEAGKPNNSPSKGSSQRPSFSVQNNNVNKLQFSNNNNIKSTPRLTLNNNTGIKLSDITSNGNKGINPNFKKHDNPKLTLKNNHVNKVSKNNNIAKKIDPGFNKNSKNNNPQFNKYCKGNSCSKFMNTIWWWDTCHHNHYCTPCYNNFYCDPWVVYYPVQTVVVQTPVVVPGQVVNQVLVPGAIPTGPAANAPAAQPNLEAPAAASGSDLMVESVLLVDVGDTAKELGPMFRVAIKNNGKEAATKFGLGLFAGLDDQPNDKMIPGGQEIDELAAGQTKAIDIRLPIDVLKIKANEKANPELFKMIFAVVDAENKINEADEKNNIMGLKREAIKMVAQAGTTAQAAPAATK